MIMRNEDLLELVAWRAKEPHAPLSPGPAFLKRITGENLERLEAAVRAARDLPPVEWPAAPERGRSQGPGPSQEKVEALLAACKKIAAELRIDPSFLASRAAVTAVVRHRPRSVEKIMEASGMMRWQAALIVPAVEAVLPGAS